MKIFLVDVHNAIDMAHYETFFFQNIKQGNISVFEKSLDSLNELNSVLMWITEEMNRNLYSVDQALVIILLPRKLSAVKTPRDYEIFAKMYIDELLRQHLDRRFSYLCFYVDDTGQYQADDTVYREIDAVNERFSSDDTVLRNSFLPIKLPEGDPKECVGNLVAVLPDRVIANYYQRVLDLLRQTELNIDESMIRVEDWYQSMFLRTCREEISDIRVFRCPYFTNDIAQKIEIVLKIVKYICSFADGFRSNIDFDIQMTEFLKPEKFDAFSVDLELIRKEIVTYRERLAGWKPKDVYDKNNQRVYFNYDSGDHSKDFEERIKKVSIDDLRSALHPSMKEVSEFDIQEKVFVSLDRLIADADLQLRSFCEERLEEMRLFRSRSHPTEIERSEDVPLNDEEKKKEQTIAEKMNQFVTNELPGYPAELKLRQELELLGKKIRKIGRYLKKMNILAFLGTIFFVLVSIGAVYYGLQYSVFNKENTWQVYGIYLGILMVLFTSSYITVRVSYHRKIRKYLKKCLDLVMEFLQTYISRATEFEKNLNASMEFYCAVDENNKKTKQRSEQTEFEKRKQWHQLKIKQILGNLSFFDGFVQGERPVPERGVPPLDLFEDDAMHSDFYQMRIFK